MYMLAGVTTAVSKNRPYAHEGLSQPGTKSKGRAPRHRPRPPRTSATPVHCTWNLSLPECSSSSSGGEGDAQQRGAAACGGRMNKYEAVV